MSKKNETSNNSKPMVYDALLAGNYYTIGKFKLLLNEETGDLKINVHTVVDSLKVQPKSDNCIILHACR